MTDAPTYSEEIEMKILGSMINSPEALKTALGITKEGEFEGLNKIIFIGIQELYKEKGCIDITLLGEHLKGRGRFDDIGGFPYLAKVSSSSGLGVDIDIYCDELRKISVKRSLNNIQRTIGEDLAMGVDPHMALERLETKVKDLKANKPLSESLYRHLLDPISETDISEEIRRTTPGASVGLRIGEIDLKVPGGAITILAGATGHGKTLVLINFILNFLKHHPDKQAFFFSYEESRSAILSLFLNTYINQELSKNNRESIKSYFREGNVKYVSEGSRSGFLEKKKEFFETLIETKRLNIFYSDYSADELVQAIRFLKKNLDIGLVGVDYMQLLSLGNKKSLPRQEELKQICLMLKDCAVDTGLPLILAAQFNRTVINEACLSPTAIGEAGDIERAANMVIGIWNRNCDGLGSDGNKNKKGDRVLEEPTMYVEIMKGRETGIGHASVFDLNGNTGKLKHRSDSKIDY